MAAAYDNSVAAADFGVTTVTSGSFTVSSSANRGIAAGLAAYDALISSVTMTLAGQSGTLVTGTLLTWNAGTARTQIFGAAAPSSGSQTVSASWTTSAFYAELCGVTAIGVDQSTPLNGGTAIEDTTPTSLPITSASGDLTFSVASNNTVSSTHTTNQTVRVGDILKLDTGPGTANPTHTWTLAANTFGVCGANFKAAGAGGRTTKNTRSAPLGVEAGMGWRGDL